MKFDHEFRVGDRVTISEEANSVWCGHGVVEVEGGRLGIIVVRMATGEQQGHSGGFNSTQLTLQASGIERVLRDLK